jgi:hypothetical protein
MLTPLDFEPDSVQDLSAITPPYAQKALANLAYRSTLYRENVGYYGNVYVKIKAAIVAGKAALAAPDPHDDTQIDQIAQAQVLAAVAYRLSRTINIAVEDEGSEQARGFFSSTVNWEELARDILDELFLPLGAAGSSTDTSFIVADRTGIDWRNFLTADEAMSVMSGRGFRRYRPFIVGSINGWW